jgi:glucosamine--fructose-6-phosphate aminotransferase (isomerizing)
VTSHMRREIAEQPAAVERTLAAVAGPVAALAGAVREREIDRVVLVARGTSDHVAIYGRYLLEARCALSSSLAAPSLYTTYRPPIDLSRALVLGVSQSGQTPEIVAALEFAAGRGALTAALTNEAGSPLAEAVSHALVTAAGDEQSVAATKTFTTALAAVAELARALGAADLAAPLGALPAALARAAALPADVVERAARLLVDAEAAVCVARGYAYAAALEAALKLKEVAGLWAEGFSAADLRHGPRAAALGLPAIILHAGGPLAGDVRGLEGELAAAGSPIVSIGPGRALEAARGLGEELAPIALIVPAQLVAEHLAVLRGRDPDRPPGLTKVTRTH